MRGCHSQEERQRCVATLARQANYCWFLQMWKSCMLAGKLWLRRTICMSPQADGSPQQTDNIIVLYNQQALTALSAQFITVRRQAPHSGQTKALRVMKIIECLGHGSGAVWEFWSNENVKSHEDNWMFVFGALGAFWSNENVKSHEDNWMFGHDLFWGTGNILKTIQMHKIWSKKSTY